MFACRTPLYVLSMSPHQIHMVTDTRVTDASLFYYLSSHLPIVGFGEQEPLEVLCSLTKMQRPRSFIFQFVIFAHKVYVYAKEGISSLQTDHLFHI